MILLVSFYQSDLLPPFFNDQGKTNNYNQFIKADPAAKYTPDSLIPLQPSWAHYPLTKNTQPLNSFTLQREDTGCGKHSFLTKRLHNAERKIQRVLLYLKSIGDGHCSRLRGGKKPLIYLQAPDCKYTASTHSRSLPHTTALFCKSLNLTWSNHILGGREGIRLPRLLIPGPPLSQDEPSL